MDALRGLGRVAVIAAATLVLAAGCGNIKGLNGAPAGSSITALGRTIPRWIDVERRLASFSRSCACAHELRWLEQ